MYIKVNLHCVQHTPSTVYTKYSILQVQHTPCTTYTKYSIHWVQHTLSTACNEYSVYWVQHTLCTAYTECNICQVQHTMNTASSQDGIFSLHSHYYGFTLHCSSSLKHASLQEHLPPTNSLWKCNCKDNLPPGHCSKLINWWTDSQHLSCLPIHNLQVVPQFRLIIASMSFFKLAQSLPQIPSQSSPDLCLQVCAIRTSGCISKHAWPWYPSVSLNLLNHSLQVNHWIPLVSAWNCMSKLTWSGLPIASLSFLNCQVLAHITLHVSAACSQRLSSVCSWIDIWIHHNMGILVHRCIDANTNWINEFQHYLMIRSNYHFHVQQQCFGWQMCQLHLQVLQRLSQVLQYPWRFIAQGCRCTWVANSSVQLTARFVTNTSRYTWRPLYWSSQWLDLSILGFQSNNFHILPETPSNQAIYYWYGSTHWTAKIGVYFNISDAPLLVENWAIGYHFVQISCWWFTNTSKYCSIVAFIYSEYSLLWE